MRSDASWGPIASFTLLGLAIGQTGAYVLWGMQGDGAQRAPQSEDEARLTR